MGIHTTPLQHLIFAYGVHASRFLLHQMPLFAVKGRNSETQNLVLLAAFLESFKTDVAQACVQYEKLYTIIVWTPQQSVQSMAKSWQDLDLRDALLFGKEGDLTRNGFSPDFAASCLEVCRESLGNMVAWKDDSQPSHQISPLMELSRCELNGSTNTCSSLGDAGGVELMKVSSLMIGIVKNIVGEDMLTSFEGTPWILSHSQLADSSNHVVSGCIYTWSETGHNGTCSDTNATSLAHGPLPDEQQKYAMLNCTEISPKIRGSAISERNACASVSSVEGSTTDSLSIQVSGEWAPADDDLMYVLRSDISILPVCHACSAIPTGFSISFADSRRSLVCRSTTLDLSDPETLTMLAIEVECLTSPNTFEEGQDMEEEVDTYWTWNFEAQKFVHVDEDTGETVYHPDEF
ncbi:hypothetical protein F4818DRAFT_433324, partial [Hypoxylon cercidicola]